MGDNHLCCIPVFLKKKHTEAKRISKYNINVIASGLLVGVCFLLGIIMLFFGIKDTYKLNETTKNYTTTNGYFSDYAIYKSDKKGTTYKLIYTYTVDNVNYTISTDYGTTYIPDENSIREVKYNPKNPKKSILVGTNSKNGLIYMGAFFTFGSLTFVLGALTILGYFDKLKIDIVGTYIGILFFIVGIGIILFQSGTTSSFMKSIQSFGLWILIPFMFIIVGIFQTIKCLFFNSNKDYHRKNIN